MAIELDELAGEEGGAESRRLAAYWHEQINSVLDDKAFKRWLKRGETIEKRYRDERSRVDEEGQRRYNALWSNVEILQPALYGKCPVPIAERRFKDKDPIGRYASQILERALRNEIEINNFDCALQRAVKDYLLPGRGTVWVRYEPEIEEGISVAPDNELDMRDEKGEIEPDEDPEKETVDADESEPEEDDRKEAPEEGTPEHEEDERKLRETGDRIVREVCIVDYIQWSDFITVPERARVWDEVVAGIKRVYMTRDQMIRRFGKDVGKKVPLQKDSRNERRQNDITAGDPSERKATVYEIWSRTDETVYWIAEGYDYLLDRKEDPLNLENFFPFPMPLYANATNNSLVPVPDYLQYQDQAIQIDELTQRIAMLSKACKVAGVYNAAAHGIRRLLDESVENELLPVDDWSAFADKGGVAGNISLLPLKEIIGVLNELMVVKKECIEEMDRLTGINDIMRGTSDARETLGGVRLKSNNTGTRLQRRQNEVARFARDTIRIIADIMCQHFSSQSLIEASGALYEEGLGPDMQPFGQQQQALPPPVTPPGGAMGAPPNAQPTPPGLGGAPPSPMGGNVVPFPGQAPQVPGGQAPGLGGPPQMGAMPPHTQDNDPMQALLRIAGGIKLLRNEKMRGFRVDIEVDSTIYGDLQQEKEDRVQFIQATTQFLGTALQMSAQVPEIAPLLGKILQFGIRGYRVGRDLEQAVEDFTDQAMNIAKQHQALAQSQGNPAVIKAQADIMKSKNDIQMTQMKGQIEQQKASAEVQRQQLEAHAQQINSQSDLQQAQADTEQRRIEQQIEMIRLQIELAKLNQQKQQVTLDHQNQQHDMAMQGQQMQHDMNMQGQQQAHEQRMGAHEASMADREQRSQESMMARREAQQAMPPKVEQEGAGGL